MPRLSTIDGGATGEKTMIPFMRRECRLCLSCTKATGWKFYSADIRQGYLEKALDGTAWRPAGRLPVANQPGETFLMLLVHRHSLQVKYGRPVR